MTVSFNPTGLITQELECICMTMYRTAGELLDGHDACSGYVPVGEVYPVFNLTNDNFINLMALLGLPAEPYYGTIEAADLLARIAAARRKPHAEFARTAGTPTPTSEMFGGKGSALTAEKLGIYLDDLAKVANCALEQSVTVSFN